MQPKVSVIVPVYGVEKYLRECLDSVINQTLKDIEIICVDDGGKDNCPQIIDEYAQKDSRVIAVHKENGGYGHSCNAGLNKASGEYVAILEPDDFIDEHMYEDLYNAAKKYDVDIVKSKFREYIDTPYKNEYREIKWKDIPEEPFNIYDCAYFLWFHPSIWSCIYRRDFLNENNIRFVEAPGAGWTDNPFQVQTMILAKKIYYIDTPYYNWRRLTTNESEDLKDWTLPFKRSDEIHQWLDKMNITEPKVLRELYKRELAYIHIVLNKPSLPFRKECLQEINKMCKRMRPEVVKIMTKNERKIIKLGQNWVWLLYLKIHNKALRRHVFQFHWRTHEKFLRLFDKTVFMIESK